MSVKVDLLRVGADSLSTTQTLFAPWFVTIRATCALSGAGNFYFKCGGAGEAVAADG
jgi:hypothetical protein